MEKHLKPADLAGKTIDAHSHVGITLQHFAALGYPYCSSVEDLYYRQVVHGVDCAIVFPSNADLFFDLQIHLDTGKLVPAQKPISKAPYALENRALLTDLFVFCPELSRRFIPFVSVDPGRSVSDQLRLLAELMEEYPIYGLKISPVAVQTPVTRLLGEGAAFLELAEQCNWPILFHVTIHPDEAYSQAADTFKVIERHPKLRYCLAHCIGLHKGFLELANSLPNVWVDTSALKIQVELAYQNSPVMAAPADRLDCDCSDHRKVMRTLVERFPKTILWGSDAPYHSYIIRRSQGEGKYYNFRLKGAYADEKAALDALSDEQRRGLSDNTVSFLFGG